MTAATINRINEAISAFNIGIERGNGYFFFYDLEGSPSYNADKIESVYSCHLRCMTLEQWVEHVCSALQTA